MRTMTPLEMLQNNTPERRAAWKESRSMPTPTAIPADNLKLRTTLKWPQDYEKHTKTT